MSKFTPPYDDLQTPFTEKTRAKLIGHIEQKESVQLAAVTLAAAHLWIATFDGQIGDAYVMLDSAPGGVEVMTYDIQKNGVTILSGLLTLDNTALPTEQNSLKSLLLPASVSFVVGDLFTVDRVYTLGDGDVEINTLVIEPSIAPYDA